MSRVSRVLADSYSFTISEGNTEQVKFYLGGDTGPGSYDRGVGVMLTQPTRSVISVNPVSGIQFGFQEIADSKPFDGATSQYYYDSMGVAWSGEDIGFAADRNEHDAGLMMQWNLGSTPGVQSAATVSGTYGVGAAISGSGLPAAATGTVTVSSGGETLCSWTIGSGTGCTLPGGLSAGEHQLLISYTGDANHLGSDATATLTIARAATAIAAPGPIEIDRHTEPVYRVTGLPENATGAVTVRNDDLGVVCTFNVAETDRCTGDELAPGTYELTVSYPGDSNHLGSSTTVTVDVARDETQVEPIEPTVEGTYGGPVTIGFENLPSDATGTVTVTTEVDGEQVELCTVTLPGDRSCVVDGLPAGSYDLTITYSGDDVYVGSTNVLEVEVARAAVALDLGATLTSDGAVVNEIRVSGLPQDATGLVTITTTSPATPAARYSVGAANVSPMAPRGTVVCTFLAEEASSCTPGIRFTAGTHRLAVDYAGDRNYLAAQGALTLNVAAVDTGKDDQVDRADSDEPAADDDDAPAKAADGELADTGVSFGVALGLPLALALLVLGGFLARRGREQQV